MTTELLIVLALLTVNGLFAGAEIAVLSVRKTRLREYIRRRDKRALAINTNYADAKRNLDRFKGR